MGGRGERLPGPGPGPGSGLGLATLLMRGQISIGCSTGIGAFSMTEKVHCISSQDQLVNALYCC